MKKNKVLQIVCLAATAFILYFFSFVSPYSDAAGEYPSFSEDAFIVLHLWGVLILLLTLLGLFLAKGSKRWVFIVYGCVIVFTVAKLFYINFPAA